MLSFSSSLVKKDEAHEIGFTPGKEGLQSLLSFNYSSKHSQEALNETISVLFSDAPTSVVTNHKS